LAFVRLCESKDVTLVNDGADLFRCGACKRWFRNNGDADAAADMLIEEERIEALTPPVCPACGADRVKLFDAFMARWYCESCDADLSWDVNGKPEILDESAFPVTVLIYDDRGNGGPVTRPRRAK
jgi:hypothetical protein